MAKIKIELDYQIDDGMSLTFIAPCDCTAIGGVIIYYPNGTGTTVSKEFIFKDAHGNDLTGVDNLFSSGSYVKIILNTTSGYAYIQNADTNKYLEGKITPTVTTVTMKSSSWNSSAKTYSFESTYPSSSYNIEIEPSNTCTEDQFEAWCSAKIVGSATSNIVKAMGDVPTVNIPVILKVVRK